MSKPAEPPDDDSQDQSVSRRGFLKYGLLGFSGLATAAGVLTPIVAYLWPPPRAGGATGARVAVSSTIDLPAGQGGVFSVANKPVIVIHTTEGEYVALSATCPTWDASCSGT